MYSANETDSKLELVAEAVAQAGEILNNGYLMLLQQQGTPGRFSVAPRNYRFYGNGIFCKFAKFLLELKSTSVRYHKNFHWFYRMSVTLDLLFWYFAMEKKTCKWVLFVDTL